MAKKKATEIGEPKVVAKCDSLYGCPWARPCNRHLKRIILKH